MTSAVAPCAEILRIDIYVPGKGRVDGGESARGPTLKALETSKNGCLGRPISIRAAGGAGAIVAETQRTEKVDALLARVGPRTKSLRLSLGTKKANRGGVEALADFGKGGDHG